MPTVTRIESCCCQEIFAMWNSTTSSIRRSTAKHRKTRQSTARYHKARHSTAKHGKAPQRTAKHGKAPQSAVKRDKARRSTLMYAEAQRGGARRSAGGLCLQGDHTKKTRECLLLSTLLAPAVYNLTLILIHLSRIEILI